MLQAAHCAAEQPSAAAPRTCAWKSSTLPKRLSQPGQAKTRQQASSCAACSAAEARGRLHPRQATALQQGRDGSSLARWDASCACEENRRWQPGQVSTRLQTRSCSSQAAPLANTAPQPQQARAGQDLEGDAAWAWRRASEAKRRSQPGQRRTRSHCRLWAPHSSCEAKISPHPTQAQAVHVGRR